MWFIAFVIYRVLRDYIQKQLVFSSNVLSHGRQSKHIQISSVRDITRFVFNVSSIYLQDFHYDSSTTLFYSQTNPKR
jgi:hypothetical protein